MTDSSILFLFSSIWGIKTVNSLLLRVWISSLTSLYKIDHLNLSIEEYNSLIQISGWIIFSASFKLSNIKLELQ